MHYEIWKGRKKIRQKAGSNSILSKSMHLTSYTTETDAKGASIFNVD